jgi:drug/metabolite transporter (DMT)-like permease
MRSRHLFVDLMLLGTVLLWALNTTVTRYVITHGVQPLAYATVRYGAAVLLFWAFTWWRERSFWIARSDLKLVALAAVLIYVNQVCFVYAVDKTSASTVTLFLGLVPIFVGMLAAAVGFEHTGRRFWLAAALSFLGVGLVAIGGGHFSGERVGYGLALVTAATWGTYSLTIAPLMRRYSPFRISSIVLGLGWLPLAATGFQQTSSQSFDFGWRVWGCFAFAVIGPLFLTNLLWFTAIDRVGPSRAALFSNLQPFFGVLFAIVLLGEHLNRWEILGGVALAVGIAVERTRRAAPAAVVAPES